MFHVSLQYIPKTLTQQNQPSLKLNSNPIGDNFFKWQMLRMQLLNFSRIDVLLTTSIFYATNAKKTPTKGRDNFESIGG